MKLCVFSFLFFELFTLSFCSSYDSEWKVRCRPMSGRQSADTVDAAVQLADGKLYLISGDSVTRHSHVDIDRGTFEQFEPDAGYPRRIRDQWPGLDSSLDAAFVLGDQMYFIKRDKVWSMWTGNGRVIGPSRLVDTLPYLATLGDIDDLGAVTFGHNQWLIVFHTLRGRSKLSIVDAAERTVLSTQATDRKTTAFEVLNRRSNGDFDAVQFTENSHHRVVVSERGLSHQDCESSNEQFTGCPASMCSESFRIDAITLLDGSYRIFSGQFVYQVDEANKELLSVSKVNSVLYPVQSKINASYAFNGQLHIITGNDLLTFDVNRRTSNGLLTTKQPLKDMFEKWPEVAVVDAAVYNEPEKAILFFVRDIFWKYDAKTREFLGIGSITDIGPSVPSNLDAAVYNVQEGAYYLFKGSVFYKVYKSFFQVEMSAWSSISEVFLNCPKSSNSHSSSGRDSCSEMFKSEFFALPPKVLSTLPVKSFNERLMSSHAISEDQDEVERMRKMAKIILEIQSNSNSKTSTSAAPNSFFYPKDTSNSSPDKSLFADTNSFSEIDAILGGDAAMLSSKGSNSIHHLKETPNEDLFKDRSSVSKGSKESSTVSTTTENLYPKDDEMKETFNWLVNFLSSKNSTSSKQKVRNHTLFASNTTKSPVERDYVSEMFGFGPSIQDLTAKKPPYGHEYDKILSNMPSPSQDNLKVAFNEFRPIRPTRSYRQLLGVDNAGQFKSYTSNNQKNFELNLKRTGLKRAQVSKKKNSYKMKFERRDDKFVYDLKYDWGYPLGTLIALSALMFLYCFWSTRRLMAGQRIPRHQLDSSESNFMNWLSFKKNKTVVLVED